MAQAVITPLALARAGAIVNVRSAAVLIIGMALAILFFFAGRSLRNSRAQRGETWPLIAWSWVAIAVIITVPFFFIQAFIIPTGSMEDTLLIGDRLIVRTFPPLIPRRGDIIAFRYPVDRRQTQLKRVIAIPGDRIHIASRIVYLNGAELNERYIVHKFNLPNNAADNLPPLPGDVRF